MNDIKYDLKYAEMTGTYYDINTPNIVKDILEESRISKNRIKVYYGDVKTGKAWGDTFVGHVGRSTGNTKIPLEIANSRSTGGGALLDHCIVQIDHANKKDGGTIYKFKI